MKRALVAALVASVVMVPSFSSPSYAQGKEVVGAVVYCYTKKACRALAKKGIKFVYVQVTNPKCKGSGSSGTANSTSPTC